MTGMGVVSCLGHDPDEFYSNLLEVDLRCGTKCEYLYSVRAFSARYDCQ